MFHPPQASIGLALLPMAWAASDRARAGGKAPERARDDDLVRYFPAAWSRESVPDAPAAAASLLRRLAAAWQSSSLAAWGGRGLRRWAPRRGALASRG
jgi:hypothetical protein